MTKRGILTFGCLWLLLGLVVCTARAQQGTLVDNTSLPIAGSGQDYIALGNETVNPANGSVILSFPLPVPPSRGLTLPISLAYQSNIFSLDPRPSVTFWTNDLPWWGPTPPNLRANAGSGEVYIGSQTSVTCFYATGYAFNDAAGGQHPLHIEYVQTTAGNHSCNASKGFQGGTTQIGPPSCTSDTCYTGELVTPTYQSPVHVFDSAGTLYAFGNATGGCPAIPDYIEDRNGNRITSHYTGGAGCPRVDYESLDNSEQQYAVFGTGFQFTDDMGRTAISWTTFKNNVAYLSTTAFTYAVTQTQVPGWSSYSVSPVLVSTPPDGFSCAPPPAIPGMSQPTMVTSIGLPNGGSYNFRYDGDVFGNLSEIDYPGGGSIQYTWTLGPDSNEQASYAALYTGQGGPTQAQGACLYRYSLPVVKTRTVSFGSGPVLTQSFDYSTQWGRSGWLSKTTTVTSSDLVSGKTNKIVHTYTPFQVLPNSTVFPGISSSQSPLEVSTVTYDEDGTNPLQTVNQAYIAGTQVKCRLVYDSNIAGALGEWYSYSGSLTPTSVSTYPRGVLTPNNCANDDRALTPPPGFLKQVLTNTISVPTNIGTTIIEPTSKMVYDGNGNLLAETDYSYDDGSVLQVSGLASGSHDETNYGSNNVAGRGNLTQMKSRCLSQCADSVSSFTYDETGKQVSATDPCGLSNCSDMSGGFHTSQFDYTDSPVGSNPAGNSNAYLTKSTDPLGHTKSSSFDYTRGLMISTSDINGNVTRYAHNDPLNRLTQVFYPGGLGSATVTYDDTPGAHKVTTMTSSQSPDVTAVTLFDGMGHVTETQQSSDPSGTVFVDTVYTGMGQVHSAGNPHRATPFSTDGTTSFVYDALGHKILQINQDGSLQSSCFNGVIIDSRQSGCRGTLDMGLAAAWVDSTDENGLTSQRSADTLGRLLTVHEPNGSTTKYDYDGLNNLTGVSQRGSSGDVRSRSFKYDSLSRLLWSLNPETGLICYGQGDGTVSGCQANGYDANGNLQYKTDARRIVSIYRYDALNRLVIKAYSDGTVSSCFQYDTSSVAGAGLNLIGRLTNSWTQAHCPAVAPSFPGNIAVQSRRSILSYDALGHLTSEQQCAFASCSKPFVYMPSYVVDAMGGLLASSNGLPVGAGYINFMSHYDGARRLLDVSSSITPGYLYSNPTYSPPGTISGVVLGAGVSVGRLFDNRGRILGESDTGTGAGVAVSATITIKQK